jgi:hypothetical protein
LVVERLERFKCAEMDLSRVCCQGFTQTTALDSDDKVSPRTLICGLRSMPTAG